MKIPYLAKVQNMTTRKKTILALVAAVVLISGYVFAQGYDGLIAPQKGHQATPAAASASIAVSPAPNGAVVSKDIYGSVKSPSTPDERRAAMMEQQRARMEQRQKDMEAARALQQQSGMTTFEAAKARLEAERQEQQSQAQH